MVHTTLLSRIQDSLTAGAHVNRTVQATPMAVLWTDADRVWLPFLPALRNVIPGLVTLGPFDVQTLTGPAVWIKCAVADVLDEVKLNGSPAVVYLPGVSRADLRAIESCPRDLQPLAELQYRGAFWSQANGKDWTVNAFLSSKNGGLGLDVAQDKTTQDALSRALLAGVLSDRPLEELTGRHIDAFWLDSLLAPNAARDILAWLNEPKVAKTKWTGARWDVFLKRCRADFSFDPVSDGVLVAVEKLAKAHGGWGAVWELYVDSYTSFPNVAERLRQVQPPKGLTEPGLFDAWGTLAGYPRANDEAESALRYKLAACGAMTSDQVRASITELEQEHSCRRDWLWTQMGLSPLVLALQHLADLARATAQLPGGLSLDQLAKSYQDTGWQADQAALQAIAAVHAKLDLDAVSAVLRSLYMPWLDQAALRFQDALKAAGRLGKRPLKKALEDLPEWVCIVFVDGLRYDVAVRLKGLLASIGDVGLDASWTSLPSVTASGKAWCAPIGHLVAGDKSDQDFEPRVAESGKPMSGHNLRKLLTEQGIQPLDKHQTGDPKGRAWVECGDLDHYGHEHGIRLARDMEIQLAQVVERLGELKSAGWRHFRIVTDHGWLLMPGGLPKTELPKHQAETRWGRCAVLKDSAHGTPLTFGWDWCEDVQIAYAPGIGNFVAGAEYAHGGLSLQECLVPVLSVVVKEETVPKTRVIIESLTWKGLRCVVHVQPDDSTYLIDIRSKPARASSSLIANVKHIENGKASVAVADDDDMGSAAVVVVLDSAGNVVQKMGTTVGG